MTMDCHKGGIGGVPDAADASDSLGAGAFRILTDAA